MSRRSVKNKSVLILTDLEGISGVCSIAAINDEEAYRDACMKLTADTNVAIDALISVGAETVYVNDGHGSGNNFFKDRLDPRAKQIPLSDFPSVIRDVSCVVLVGMHAMSGTLNAFLDHTQSSMRIHHYFYNGERIGELSQIGVYSGFFGIPCVAVTGDEAVCREACRVFPGISTATVKFAKGRNSADCIPEAEAHDRIRHAVIDGFCRREEIKPMSVSLPLTVDVEFHRTDYADEAVAKHPELERIDGYTVRSVKDNIESYFDVLIMWG